MSTAPVTVPTTPRTEPTTTVGRQLQGSPAVKSAIDALVGEIRSKSAQITDVRPAVAGMKESYDGLMDRAKQVRGRPLLYPYIGSGVGNGALVELADGSVKWDMICGIGVHFFGHSEPDLAHTALSATVTDTFKQGNLQANFEPHSFGETLLKEASRSSRLKYAYTSTSGVMANENAVKVCYQKHAPASRVIAFADCFMGRSTTMAQIGDSADGRVGLPLNVAVDYMPFYDEVEAARIGQSNYIDRAVAMLRQYVTRYPGQHACFIFELIQGEGGFNVGQRDFFRALMDLCKASKIAVWDDEIQTFGRTPRMFAYELFDLGQYVDVLCVGKMTQVCATLYTEEYNPKAGLLSGTFIGDAPSFAVGQRVIERLRDGQFYGDDGLFAKHHSEFRRQVKLLAAKRPEWFPAVPEVADVAGGIGGLMRMTPFGGRKDKIQALCKSAFDEGVILFYCGHGPYHVRMLPPLPVFKMEDWPRVFACLERALAKVGS